MEQKNEKIEELLKNFQVKRIEPVKKPADVRKLAEYGTLKEQLQQAEKVLVGIGAEWRADRVKENGGDIQAAYEVLAQILGEKDYFIVTTNTDAEIFNSSLDAGKIVAPCGNETWRQCSRTCTKDIWEPGEIPDDICPHCGAPLTGNTRDAVVYIEEGYLPQWQKYTHWLTTTLNQRLLILELGEGFKTPTVIRWPFEKTVLFNQKSFMYRVNEKYAQLADGMQERAAAVGVDSVEWIKEQVQSGNC